MAENKLLTFLTDLGTNPEKLAQFQRDPDTAMNNANLSNPEKAVLRSGDSDLILTALFGGVHKRKVPAPPPIIPNIKDSLTIRHEHFIIMSAPDGASEGQ